MMLRATLFALAPLSASAFKLVSQTFKGEHKDKYSNPYGGLATHTVEFGLDMESVKFRSNHHVVGQMPNSNTSFNTQVSVIFDVEAKRVTTWHDIEDATLPTPECMYSEFPSLPAPAVVAKCLQDFAADAEPATSEDGLQKFQIPILRTFSYSVKTSVHTDESFVMKKVIADWSQPEAHAMPIHVEMTDMNSKAGAPDSSVFVVPKGWGTCTNINAGFLGINNIDPVMRAFSHCMELGATRAPIIV